MPELVSVEKHQVARGRVEFQMPRLAGRIVLIELADELAAGRPVEESHENGVARPLVVRRVVVKSDVVSGLGIVVQRAGVRVRRRTQLQRGFGNLRQERQKPRRPVEVQKARRLFGECIETDAAALLVAGNEVSIQIGLHRLRQRGQPSFDQVARQKLRDQEKFVLRPVLVRQPSGVQRPDRPVHRLFDRSHCR